MAILFNSPAQADIVLGVAGPLSGTYAALGQQMVAGAQAAVDAINAQGGIESEQLKLISGDDGCDNRRAEDVAQKFIDAKVVGVIGHYCSNASLAAGRLYDKAGIVMVAPVASQPNLTTSGLSTVFRMAARDDMQGAFAAQRILQKRPDGKVALVLDGTAANKAIAASFVAALSKAPALSFEFKPDTQDFADLIARLKSENIDAVYFACGASDAGHISLQALKAGLPLKRYGPDAMVADLYGTAAGPAANGMLASFTYDPQKPYQSHGAVAALKLAGQSADGATLPSYAAVEVLAAAISQGADMAHWLKSGTVIDTVEGPISFDENGDPQTLRFSWYVWTNGTYQALPEGN